MRGQPGPAFGRPGCKLDPRIPLRDALCPPKRDGRDKPGHDKVKGAPLLRDSRDIIRPLLQDGFEQVSVRGSHHKFVHAISRRVVIVTHPSKDIPRGTVRAIYNDAGWPKD